VNGLPEIPTVWVEPDTELHRAVIELQQLALNQREQIITLTQRVEQAEKDARNAGLRVDDKFSQVRKELNKLSGIHGS